uniref:Transposase-associated domain-containing protein n=1 Tax=Ananas comosus var. bracteatus TaxID=296719 RepID=A0A6V7PHA0_ANACO|nr:unnamed protein product [Ananas comosus var. bracteatus]
MDIKSIKDNLDWPRGSFQYLAGVNGFLDFAFLNPSSDRKIRCPCVKCVNRTTLSREDMYDHLVCDGMLRGYRDWIFHGESIAQNFHTGAHQLDDDSTMHVNMHQMIHDMFGVRNDEESMSHLSNASDSQENGSNSEAENFFSLLRDADQNLWPGCELTKLSLILLLFHTKCTNKWNNAYCTKSFFIYVFIFVILDETGRRTSGKTLLADLWGLPPGHLVVVDCNTYGQPIGNEGGLLGQFLGTIARNGGLCSLSHKDWRYFLYHQSCEKWIFKSVGRKWKDYKCGLKARYFDDLASLDEMYKKVPEDIVRDQWISLVNFWKTETAEQKHLERKEPTRAEVYLKTHKYKTRDFVNDKLAADLQAKIVENQESSNSHGRVAWEGDAYSDVIGKDKYGYMHSVGLGPSPTELLKPIISSRFDGIQITTLDEIISERNMRQMKEEIEKLQQQLRSQNETIVELKNKM